MTVLQRRVGPWPVWAWGGIIVSGAGLGLLLRRSSLFGDHEPEPAAEDEGSGADGQYLERPTLPTTGAVPLPVVTAPSGSTSKPTTNLEWGRLAVDWLIAQNVPPVTAQAAVSKYLEGVSLTAAESATLALALRQLGSPPEGAPVPQAPAPTTPTVPIDPRSVPPRGALRSPEPLNARGDRNGAWLGWSTVPGATAYWVRAAVEGSGDWGSWQAVGLKTSAFKRTPVRRKTTYVFQVRAMKGTTAGPAARSNPVVISP